MIEDPGTERVSMAEKQFAESSRLSARQEHWVSSTIYRMRTSYSGGFRWRRRFDGVKALGPQANKSSNLSTRLDHKPAD